MLHSSYIPASNDESYLGSKLESNISPISPKTHSVDVDVAILIVYVDQFIYYICPTLFTGSSICSSSCSSSSCSSCSISSSCCCWCSCNSRSFEVRREAGIIAS